jgi:hypothetical protein
VTKFRYIPGQTKLNEFNVTPDLWSRFAGFYYYESEINKESIDFSLHIFYKICAKVVHTVHISMDKLLVCDSRNSVQYTNKLTVIMEWCYSTFPCNIFVIFLEIYYYFALFWNFQGLQHLYIHSIYIYVVARACSKYSDKSGYNEQVTYSDKLGV